MVTIQGVEFEPDEADGAGQNLILHVEAVHLHQSWDDHEVAIFLEDGAELGSCQQHGGQG